MLQTPLGAYHIDIFSVTVDSCGVIYQVLHRVFGFKVLVVTFWFHTFGVHCKDDTATDISVVWADDGLRRNLCFWQRSDGQSY